MQNTLETVAGVVALLEAQAVRCHVFGGWAEEILGLRPPWPHSDIDLLHQAGSFELLDAAMTRLATDIHEVSQKRFHHKRAFLFGGMLCEITLVEGGSMEPVTHYWGDTAFRWNIPLLHAEAFCVRGQRLTTVSAENLRRHRAEKNARQPHRWQEQASADKLRET